MVKPKIIFLKIIFLFFFCYSTISHAAFDGPLVVAVAEFGDTANKISIESDDMGDNFTELFYPLDESIAIADGLHIKIFKNALLLKEFNLSPNPEFIGGIYFFDGGIYLLGSVPDSEGFLKDHIYLYDYSGKLLSKLNHDSYQGGLEKVLTNGNFITRNDKTYYKYTSKGELLKTYTKTPLELGRTKEETIDEGLYRVTVTYPDKEWVIVSDGICPNFIRDQKGYIYCTGDKHIIKYNDCGKKIAELALPADEVNVSPSPIPGYEDRYTVISEHGSLTVAPNGDLYAWKRTKDFYSILKWTWQDDPNAPAVLPDPPTNLKAEQSPTGIKLTWWPSYQDPGCVVGYEVVRGTTSSDPFNKLSDVAKGIREFIDTTAQAGTTYYYRVRAKASDGTFSDYSSIVAGTK